MLNYAETSDVYSGAILSKLKIFSPAITGQYL